ncbi:MAG: hypothetical protein B0D91_02095 [Oceanospirillales bacterium LUC14_002_19_P2]|nr:MAG: hypothetical protein B0D91_02095 [Oceanospirillales bacterium LUC14_002_19_P2]
MKKIAAIALAGVTAMSVATVQADTFVGLVAGSHSADLQTPSGLKGTNNSFDNIIKNDGMYGIRVGQQNDGYRFYATYDNASNSYRTYKMRQENLTVSLDKTFDVGTGGTQLFAGATTGITKLTHESKDMRRDNDLGYAMGLQAGIIQKLGSNFSVEGGYRYMRHNAKVDVKEHGGNKLGSSKLKSSDTWFLSANYHF